MEVRLVCLVKKMSRRSSNQDEKQPSYQNAVVDDTHDGEFMIIERETSNHGRFFKRVAFVAILALGMVALVSVATAKVHSSQAHEAVSHVDNSPAEARRSRILDTLHRLRSRLDGDVYFPDDSEFEQAATVWCVGVQPPMVVIEPAHEHDVQLVVPVLANLSRFDNFPFRIRSGGHHKAGFSTVQEGAVLSMVRLNDVHLHTHNDTAGTAIATMGTAVTVSQFFEEVMIPHGYGGVVGFCTSVAEGGFVLGGGLGLQSRLYGLGADSVQSLRIVMADGTLLQVSATSHAELFWALRGAGGGNFGVVTEMEYTVHQSYPDIYYTMLILTSDTTASVMHQLGQLEPELPGNLLVMVDDVVEVLSDQFNINFLWSAGTHAEFLQGEPFVSDLVKTLLAGAPTPAVNVSTEVVSWAAISGPSAAGNSTSGWGSHVWAAQTWTGYLHPDNNTIEVWKDITSLIAQGVDACEHLVPDIELWGGAIHDTAWNKTAFAHRDAVWNVGVLLMIPDTLVDAEAVYEREAAKVNAWWHDVDKYLTGSYVNYPMITLGDAYPRAFWGDNLPRLVQEKLKVDPDNVFNFPMSVPTRL